MGSPGEGQAWAAGVGGAGVLGVLNVLENMRSVHPRTASFLVTLLLKGKWRKLSVQRPTLSGPSPQSGSSEHEKLLLSWLRRPGERKALKTLPIFCPTYRTIFSPLQIHQQQKELLTLRLSITWKPLLKGRGSSEFTGNLPGSAEEGGEANSAVWTMATVHLLPVQQPSAHGW